MRNSYFRGHWSGRKPPQGTLRYLQWAEKTRGHCHLRCLGVAVSPSLRSWGKCWQTGLLPPQCLLQHEISMTPCLDLRV